ncbi:hypothetical protein K474DRAFT_1663454 [Panus rudis PR-1116 ss-1]|nr:hypothetical protein K474DRAFT_1663454 [Panus rudis PR-1116 ss-1]
MQRKRRLPSGPSLPWKITKKRLAGDAIAETSGDCTKVTSEDQSQSVLTSFGNLVQRIHALPGVP